MLVLNYQKCNQTSSDGPNVNLKFLDLLNEKRRDDCLNELISIDTCGLHTVTRVFQNAENSTDWCIKKVLSAMHKIFHKSLSRRAVYEKVSSATKEAYPFLFCRTCWIESQLVAKKAQIIWPKSVAVVDFWSFRMVPFLKIHVIRYMCSKFILNVLEKAQTTTSLIKLNMLDRNIQKLTAEVSFGLESHLKDLKKEKKVKESEVHLFLQEVKQFIATLCNHL